MNKRKREDDETELENVTKKLKQVRKDNRINFADKKTQNCCFI